MTPCQWKTTCTECGRTEKWAISNYVESMLHAHAAGWAWPLDGEPAVELCPAWSAFLGHIYQAPGHTDWVKSVKAEGI